MDIEAICRKGSEGILGKGNVSSALGNKGRCSFWPSCSCPALQPPRTPTAHHPWCRLHTWPFQPLTVWAQPPFQPQSPKVLVTLTFPVFPKSKSPPCPPSPLSVRDPTFPIPGPCIGVSSLCPCGPHFHPRSHYSKWLVLFGQRLDQRASLPSVGWAEDGSAEIRRSSPLLPV